MKGVMLEDLEDCQDDIRSVAQYAQSFLCAALEYTLSFCRAKAIHHISRKSERNTFWYRQQFSLINVTVMSPCKQPHPEES